MDALRLLILACAAMAVSSQTCPNLTLVILVDTSENSKEAATDDPATPFNILQDQIRRFLSNPYFSNPRNNISMAIHGYNSVGGFKIVEEWKTVAETLLLVPKITTTTTGGSWTYQGLASIQVLPLTSRNIILIISSQGSTTTKIANMAFAEAERLRKNGWFLSVTAVQGENVINMTELTPLNNGVKPNVVRDPTGSKGYRNLAAALDYIPGLLGCVAPTIDELCSQCLWDGGFYHVADPEYCDAYVYCKDNPPTKLACPDGTFYQNGVCNHINQVTCPVGECTTNTPANTYYPSFRCYNKYFECKGGVIVTRQCPGTQIFNNAIKACENMTDPQAKYDAIGRHLCDVNVKPAGPEASEPITCPWECEMDPKGDPCKMICYNQEQQLSLGTTWSKQLCAIIGSDACQVVNDTTTRDLSPDCTANFLVNFNGGGRQVFNQRTGSYINAYSTTREVVFANGSAIYTAAMTDPYIYWFYLANVDFGVNFAFRLRFKLAIPTIGFIYDLLSNNYCSECPETISFTTTATSATDRTVSVQFLITSGMANIKANISLSNPDMWLEIIVVFADTTIYGELKELAQDGTTVIKRSQFTTFTKPVGSTIVTNRCGIQLGRGPNKSLVGSIDEFALHRFCQNMTMITS